MIIEEILVNLVFIIGLIAAAGYLAWKIYNFIKMPKVDQFEAVREWLLWAVAEAEKLYGSGTGALKLRYVYDLFLSRFKELEYFIPFDEFSKMVDDSLVGFRDLLGKNEKINNYVEGSDEEAK
jgi:hypothetical protein